MIAPIYMVYIYPRGGTRPHCWCSLTCVIKMLGARTGLLYYGVKIPLNTSI